MKRAELNLCAGLLLSWTTLGAASGADYAITVDLTKPLGVVSPELMGFNAVYCNEPDVCWQQMSGGIPDLLAQLGTQLVRYPGGTVTTFYHWQTPTGQGWADTWNPAFNPAKNKPSAMTMSLDEYLDLVKAGGITPLVGVNMGSGKKFNRVEDGIAEAQALVRHCLERGAHVTYYYLDNEPYARDANFTYTAEEYAAQINRYAPALKAVDPHLQIIANLHPGVSRQDYTRTVVKLAGANIDVVDIHNYWRHGSASFAAWQEEPHMLHQRAYPYSEQRAIYRKLFADEGHPDIELAVLEWNVGPPGAGKAAPTGAESALIAGEQFIQYIQSGLKLACFWPLHWESGDPTRALLSSARDYAPNKVHGMFRLFAGIGGRMQVASAVTGTGANDRLTHLALLSRDGTTLWVYLINKNQDRSEVGIDIDVAGLGPAVTSSAAGFESSDVSTGPLAVPPVRVSQSDGRVTLRLPRNSFAKVIVARDAGGRR